MALEYLVTENSAIFRFLKVNYEVDYFCCDKVKTVSIIMSLVIKDIQ